MATADFLCFRNCFLSRQTGEVTNNRLLLLLLMIIVKNKVAFFSFVRCLQCDLSLVCCLGTLEPGKLLLN